MEPGRENDVVLNGTAISGAAELTRHIHHQIIDGNTGMHQRSHSVIVVLDKSCSIYQIDVFHSAIVKVHSHQRGNRFDVRFC